MSQGPIKIPEPFRSALAAHAPQGVCDADAVAPEALYGRAMARIAAGREGLARQDLEAAMAALGDFCGIELAFLDIRQRVAVDDAMVRAKLILDRVEPESWLNARTLHVTGLIEAKLRHSPEAIEHLDAALKLYRKLGDRLGLAHVRDTLGMVEGACGRLDNALQNYSLSLVDKTLLGDRYGMAVTLGNIGRLHLRGGRFLDAIDCFESDLQIARDIGDQRGIARMLEDLGRVYLARGDMALGDLARAEAELTACITMAETCKFTDLLFFAHKDLALVRVGQRRFVEAAKELELAHKALPSSAEAYLPFMLAMARGELFVAMGDSRAVDVLRPAVEGIEKADLPDLFIPALIVLAKALIDQKLTMSAEDYLARGLYIARRDGYGRYLTAINETMAALNLVEPADNEKSRQKIDNRPLMPSSGYILREQLGDEGGYGITYRAYDPQRAQFVALKRLKLEKLYDAGQRERLLTSARVELAAASRVRHPGIARVLAIGTESDGTTYIVQEYIKGRPLHKLFAETRAQVKSVLSTLEKIASALQVLHDAGVIHRDLKPSNILVNELGLPVLIDFGIAHIRSSKPTQEESIYGTLGYMPPEQVQGEDLDGRADIYSLGVIAYKWLSGVLPIETHAKTVDEIIEDTLSKIPQPLSELRPDLPRGVEALVMRLLQKAPARRPGSADEVARSCRNLAAAIKDLPERPTPAAADTDTPPRSGGIGSTQ